MLLITKEPGYEAGALYISGAIRKATFKQGQHCPKLDDVGQVVAPEFPTKGAKVPDWGSDIFQHYPIYCSNDANVESYTYNVG